MQRVFKKLTPGRAVPLLVVSIMAITPGVSMGAGTSAAQARTVVNPLLTHEGAEQTALKAAKALWGKEPWIEGCFNTGVNEAKHVQWECYGWFGTDPYEGWYVGVGPYGEVLQHERN